jgi:hypothetical protein
MNRFVVFLGLCWAAMLVAAIDPLPLAAAEPAASWELSPYRIQLLIAVEPGGWLPRDLADELRVDLPARAAATVGGSWQFEAALAPPELRHTLLTTLADVTAERLPAEALAGDKVILLAVANVAGGCRLQARELDMTTGLWNSVVTREVAQSEQIPGAAFAAVLAAFAPLARIDAVESGTVTLRLKAGAIARRDRALPVALSGAAFRPVLVSLDAQGKLQANSAQPIDWTFLTATSGGGSVATCRIDTGLAGEPIPAHHPRRIRLALGATPTATAMRLKLVSSGASPSPLEGYEVIAQAGDTASGKSLGISDARGSVTIPPGAATVQVLLVRQGSQTLARLPIVPGLVTEIQLALADDRQRLEIETALLEVEDGLIDMAARRQALAARIKLAKKAGDADATKLTPKLRALASVEPQSAQLDQVEKSLKAADPRTQSLLQPKLDALRKLAQNLGAQSPTALLDEPKPAEPKPDEAKK